MTRVCVASDLGAIHDMAASAGIAANDLPDGTVPYGTTAIVMIGDGRVSYGDIRAEIFGERYYRVSTSRPLCQDGAELAMVFEAASPPRGGRVIDLAITDPAIFIWDGGAI